MVEQAAFEQARFEQGMFADSMLQVSRVQRSLRSWTTLTSFGLQIVVIGLLLVIPLLRTVGLPAGRVLPTPLSWGAPPPAPPAQHHATTVVESNLADNVLIMPRSIPQHVAVIEETVAPPQVSYNDVGVNGGLGSGSRDGIWRSLGDSTNRAVLPPPPPAPNVRPFRTSSMLQGSLIHTIQPVYPPLARTARIQGSVVLSAVIGKDGSIKDLRALSGHPMLVTAAVNAVSQWRYRPYILNNEPIEVETQITVNFTLAGN
jgi:periplasmic protein TonB